MSDTLETILVLEDDAGVARLQRRQLERAGFHVVETTDPAQATAMIQAGGVDLLVLDYRLPGNRTGLELYAQLKAQGHDLPVVLVTGHSEEAVAIAALRAGVRDFLTKSTAYLDYLPDAVERVLKQVRLEKRLAVSEAELSGVVRSVMDAIITADAQGRVTLLNAAAEEMFGCTHDLALGRPVEQLIAGCQQACDQLGGSHVGRSATRWQSHGIRAGGQRFPLEVSASLIGSHGRSRFTIVAHDLSDWLRAEEDIRQQAMLLDKAHDAIIVRDLDNRIVSWNRGAQRLYGWTAAEAVGRLDTILYADEAANDFERANAKVLADGEWAGQLRKAAKDGSAIVVESSWTLVRDDQGQPVAKLTIDTDITEKKALEEQYRHAQRMESIGTLAGGVAHEFNNLLQAIRGYTTFAMEQLTPGSQPFEDLEQVLKASDRAAVLTRQLLTFGRREVLERAPHDVNEIVRDLLKLIKPLIGENIEVRTSLAETLGMIDCDAAQLQQVLLNLCVNARDAMPAGGCLHLKTRNITLTQAYGRMHSGTKPGPYVQIVVSDTGCGMTPEVRQRIFEPFFTTKAVGKGTGLGLAVAYGIMQQHEGTIQVYSEPTRGTTFRIYLPMIAHCTPVVADDSHVPVRGGDELVLVAEDEPLVRQVAIRILQEAGYRTLVAADGAEAVRLFEQQADEIDLVLLDAIMPKLSGHDAYRRITNIRPEIPVIFCTGYDCDPDRTQSEAVPLVSKPFDPDQLRRLVRSELDRERTGLVLSAPTLP